MELESLSFCRFQILRKCFCYSMLILFAFSCSSVKLSSRKGEDVNLKRASSLVGKYTMVESLLGGSVLRHEVILKGVGENSIRCVKMLNDSIMSDVVLNGKIKRGYFKVKREWETDFQLGPLLWSLNDKIEYMGLTNENNLVIMQSYGGLLFIVFFPIDGYNRQGANIYTRIK